MAAMRAGMAPAMVRGIERAAMASTGRSFGGSSAAVGMHDEDLAAIATAWNKANETRHTEASKKTSQRATPPCICDITTRSGAVKKQYRGIVKEAMSDAEKNYADLKALAISLRQASREMEVAAMKAEKAVKDLTTSLAKANSRGSR